MRKPAHARPKTLYDDFVICGQIMVKLLHCFSIKLAINRLRAGKKANSSGWWFLCWCWRCRACLWSQARQHHKDVRNVGDARKVCHNCLLITLLVLFFLSMRAPSLGHYFLLPLLKNHSLPISKRLRWWVVVGVRQGYRWGVENDTWIRSVRMDTWVSNTLGFDLAAQALVACRRGWKTASKQIAEKCATKNRHIVPYVQTHDCHHSES